MCVRACVIKMRGLFKGMASPLFGVAAVNALLFGAYGVFLDVQMQSSTNTPTLWQIFFAGCGSGFINSFVSTPMELVKIRLQNQGMMNNPLPYTSAGGGHKVRQSAIAGIKSPSSSVVTASQTAAPTRTYSIMSASTASPRQYTGPLDCFLDIYKKRGLAGIYRGLGVTFIRETPSYGAYFASYEYLCRNLAPHGTDPKEVSGWRLILAGMLCIYYYSHHHRHHHRGVMVVCQQR